MLTANILSHHLFLLFFSDHLSKHVKTHTNPSARSKAQKLLENGEKTVSKLPSGVTMDKKLFPSPSEMMKSDPHATSGEVSSTTSTPEPDSAFIKTRDDGFPSSRNHIIAGEEQKLEEKNSSSRIITNVESASTDTDFSTQDNRSSNISSFPNFDLNNNSDSSSNNKQNSSSNINNKNNGLYNNNLLENDVNNKNMNAFSIMNISRSNTDNRSNNNNASVSHHNTKKLDNIDSSQFSILSPATSPSTSSSASAGGSPYSRSVSRESATSSVENNSLSGSPIVMQSSSMTSVKPASPSFYSNQFAFHPHHEYYNHHHHHQYRSGSTSTPSPQTPGSVMSTSSNLSESQFPPTLTSNVHNVNFNNTQSSAYPVHPSHFPFYSTSTSHFATSNANKASSPFW